MTHSAGELGSKLQLIKVSISLSKKDVITTKGITHNYGIILNSMPLLAVSKMHLFAGEMRWRLGHVGVVGVDQ